MRRETRNRIGQVAATAIVLMLAGCAGQGGSTPQASIAPPAAVRSSKSASGDTPRRVEVIEQRITEERWHPPVDVDEAEYVRREKAAARTPPG